MAFHAFTSRFAAFHINPRFDSNLMYKTIKAVSYTHLKNFSFTIQKSDTSTWQWHLAPAYDLTLCTEGYNGEHATSVNGTGHPTIQDMITIGTKSKMNKLRCMRIIEEIRTGCGDLLRNKDWE